MLEFRDVSKRFGRSRRDALHRLTLTFSEGEVLGLVGLNGAGKTTTIRIAAGVILTSGGDVVVEGKSITTDKAQASRSIGWVPETPAHDPRASLSRLCNYYADLRGDHGSTRARDLLSEWGVLQFEGRAFGTLSLGERKRFALAVAGVGDPAYYLLDEVFNGLDPLALTQVRNWILQGKKTQKGFLVSSHQLREVQAISDRIAFLHEGRLIRCLDAREIPSSSRKRLQIAFDPIDANAMRILGSFGEVEQGRGGVTLTGEGVDPAAINMSLVRAGYSVRRLEAADPELETFFLHLIGEQS